MYQAYRISEAVQSTCRFGSTAPVFPDPALPFHSTFESHMKLSGCADADLPVEEIVSVTLAEVTLCATPVELRRIAEFLALCAAEMDRMGEAYDHIHLSDRMREFQSSPHLVVARRS